MDNDLQKLRAIAQSWVGTPFRDDAAVKGRGADCKLLAIAVACEWLGIPTPNPARFANSGARWVDEGRVRRAFEKHFAGIYAAASAPVRGGDILVIQMGELAHCGIAVDDFHLLHTMRGPGAIIEPLARFAGLGISIYRRVEARP